MITAKQADKLRELIAEYRDAEIEDSWKGAGDPAGRAEIEANLAVAKRDLEQFIHELEHGPGSVPAQIAAVKA
jgi:hypothetical protein